METTPVPQPQRRMHALRWYAWLTGICGVIPFLLYGHAIAFLRLPTPAEWYTPGVRSGPWDACLHGALLRGCWLVLLIVLLATSVTGPIQSVLWKDWRPFLVSLGLTLLQLALFASQLSLLFWTIG